MSERNFYVFCDDNCKFESMTKEQILTAITQAVESHEITDVDTGFVTKIKEQNHNTALKFWIGTQAEYNALTPEENCFYIISDENTKEEIDTALALMQAQINAIPPHNVVLFEGSANVGDTLTITDYDKFNLFEVEISASVGTIRILCTKTNNSVGYLIIDGNKVTTTKSSGSSDLTALYWRVALAQDNDTSFTVHCAQYSLTADFEKAAGDKTITKIIGIA